MTKINFNEAPEQKPRETTASDKPKTMRPGIHDVTVTGVSEPAEGHVGNPFVSIGFVNEAGDVITNKLYMTEKARQWSVLKIKNVVESAELVVPEEITVDALNKMLTGKEMVLKVSGEEAMIDDRQNEGQKVKIVRSVIEDFRATASKANRDQLKFNPANDIERLVEEVAPAAEGGSGLPF